MKVVCLNNSINLTGYLWLCLRMYRYIHAADKFKIAEDKIPRMAPLMKSLIHTFYLNISEL